MKPPSTKLLAVAGAVLFAVVAAVAAAGNTLLPGVHNGVITACIEPVTQGNPATSGDLNMFHCATGAKRLSWNIRGPAGPEGAKGAEGSKGPEGAAGHQGSQGQAGAKGDTGSRGPAGPKGETGAKGDTGTTGPIGPAGAVGPQVPSGAGGTLTTTVVTSQDASGQALNSTAHATADCPTGTVLTGGGGTVSNSVAGAQGSVQLIGSQPSGNGWVATGAVSTALGSGNLMEVTAYAVCATLG